MATEPQLWGHGHSDPGAALRWPKSPRLLATDTVGTPTGGRGSARMDLVHLRGSWMDLGWLGITWTDLVCTPGLHGDLLGGPRSPWTELGAPGWTLCGTQVLTGTSWVDPGAPGGVWGNSWLNPGPRGCTSDLWGSPGRTFCGLQVSMGTPQVAPGPPGWSWDLWGSPGWAWDHLDAPGDILRCPGPCEDVGTSRVGLGGQGPGFHGDPGTSWGHPGGPGTWGDLLGEGTRPI